MLLGLPHNADGNVFADDKMGKRKKEGKFMTLRTLGLWWWWWGNGCQNRLFKSLLQPLSVPDIPRDRCRHLLA